MALLAQLSIKHIGAEGAFLVYSPKTFFLPFSKKLKISLRKVLKHVEYDSFNNNFFVFSTKKLNYLLKNKKVTSTSSYSRIPEYEHMS